MPCPAATVGFSLLSVGLPLLTSSVQADAPRAPASPADLKMEVQALQTLYHFKFTHEQLQALTRVAKQTAQPHRERKPGKISEEYEQVLTDLRNALIDANDEDGIDNLEDKLDEVAESESVDLDNDVEVTAAARQRVPEMVRQLKPSQLASYLGYIADDALDPSEHLRNNLGKVRDLKGDKWKEKRDEIADDVAWLVAGADADKAGCVHDRVVALLSKTHSLSARDFMSQQGELEKEAEKIIGDVSAAAVLEHTVERALAELLSNPRLEAALKARLP
jgi:hypothetical protein